MQSDRPLGALWGCLATLDPTITIEKELRVVNDGIITSAGVSAGIDMALSVVESLHGQAVANGTAHFMEYQRVPVRDQRATGA